MKPEDAVKYCEEHECYECIIAKKKLDKRTREQKCLGHKPCCDNLMDIHIISLKDVIELRGHKYDEQMKCSCADEWKGYMKGWSLAYKDLLEILEIGRASCRERVCRMV